jgi:LysM repeat protein
MKDSPANSNHSKSGRMGFMIVMLLMFSTAIFITVCASNRSAGVAWGNLQDDQENKDDNAQFPAGFVVIDMSGAVANDMDLTDETIGIGPLPEEEGLSDYGYGGEVLMASSESSDFATDDVDPEVDVIAPEEEKEVRVEKESAESADKAEGAEKAKVPEGTKEVSEVVLSEVKTKWEEYTVKAGETLIDIASRYNVTVEDITKANELKNPNRLTLNQKLLIPHSPDDVEIVLEEVRTRKARLAEKQRKVKPLEVTTYTVANGDSLWSISNTFSLEIDTLFGSNDLKDPNVLKPGKQLRIPNQDGIFYTVKKGDTLDSIVKKFQISIDKVKEINESRVDLAILKIGEELFLPEARPEVSAPSSVTKTSPC